MVSKIGKLPPNTEEEISKGCGREPPECKKNTLNPLSRWVYVCIQLSKLIGQSTKCVNFTVYKMVSPLAQLCKKLNGQM